MYFRVSWDQEFDDLMFHLWSKYGKKLFTLDGIGEQLDLQKFSKNFFNNPNTTADVSVDANANVVAKTGIEYNFEMPKPLKRYNSYFLLWKELRKKYGLEYANTTIESQLTGDIYINDFTDIACPYSYHKGTTIHICSIDQKDKHAITMERLFGEYITHMVEHSDYDSINLEHFNLSILDVGWVPLKQIVRHKTDQPLIKFTTENGNVLIVTADHPCILAGHREKKAEDVQIGDLFIEDAEVDVPVVSKEIYDKNSGYVYDVTTSTGTFESNHILCHNCFNYSTYDIALEGLNGISKRLNVSPPQNLSTFLRQVEQFMVVAANSTLGATGFADILLVAAKYVEKIQQTGKDGHVTIDPSDLDTYVREKLTEFIYTVNWEFRGGGQSPFSNVSIYDGNFLLNLCPDYQVSPKTVQKLQRIYLDVMNTEMHRTPLTFPVTTACFAVDENMEIQDEEFLQYIAEMNKEFGFINLYNGTTSTLSSCCFGNDTLVEPHGPASVYSVTFEQLYAMHKDSKCDVRLGMKKQKATVIRIPAPKKMYQITDKEGHKYTVTPDHIHCTSEGDKTTEQLKVGDYLTYEAVYVHRDLFDEKTSKGRVVQFAQNWEVRVAYSAIADIQEIEYTHPWVYCVECENKNIPYFTLWSGLITHNCRLRSERKSEYFNSFGAGSTKIGSLGVVTANIPRAAKKANGDYDKFMENVHELFVMAQRINSCKRKLINKRIELDAAPLYSHGYMDLSKQYSTFGVVGINEAVQLMGMDILTPAGQRLVVDLLDHISEWIDQAEKEEHAPHNVEQVPAESSAVKLAKKDEMLGYKIGVPLYSNQFIPLITKADMLDRLRLQGMFDSKLSGGAIAHINVGEPIADTETIVNLMKFAAKQGVVYWAINYKLNCCSNKHTWVGTETCPTCGKHWDSQITRVVGFFTTVKNWNPTRREHDWPQRQFYNEQDLSVD